MNFIAKIYVVSENIVRKKSDLIAKIRHWG